MKHTFLLSILLLSTLAVQSQTIRRDTLLLSRKQVFVVRDALNELDWLKSARLRLLDTIMMLRDDIVQMDADTRAHIALVNKLSDSRDLAIEAKWKVEWELKQAKEDANYKPFGISPVIIYDVRGKVNAGIGISYTPKFLRFRL